MIKNLSFTLNKETMSKLPSGTENVITIVSYIDLTPLIKLIAY